MAAVNWNKSRLNKTTNTADLKSRNGIERIKNSFQWSNETVCAIAPSLNVKSYEAGMKKWGKTLAVIPDLFSKDTKELRGITSERWDLPFTSLTLSL